MAKILRPDAEFWNKSDESSKTDSPKGEKSRKTAGTKAPPKPPTLVPPSPPPTGPAKEKPSPYAFFTMACAFCLMVVGLPVLNQKTSRGVAGDSDPANMSIVTKEDGTQYTTQVYKDENRYWKVALMKVNQERTPSSKAKNNFFQNFKSVFFGDKERDLDNEDRVKILFTQQQQKALYLIKTGQRKLASVGREPRTKELFSMQVLKSRYNTRWKRGKLLYATLRENTEPVPLPAMDQVIHQYDSLFPQHTSVRKLSSDSEEVEIYELQNEEGNNTAQVETLKDIEGRMLSINVY